jgi:hypothetical protein
MKPYDAEAFFGIFSLSFVIFLCFAVNKCAL